MFTRFAHRTIRTRIDPFVPRLLRWRDVPPAPVFLLALAVLTACGGADAARGGDAAEPPAAAESATEERADGEREPNAATVAKACEDYALAIADLGLLEAAWPAALAEMRRGATTWQPDAQLVELTVGCDWGVTADCVDLSDDGEVTVGDDCGIDGGENLAWDGVFYTADDYYWHSADDSTFMVMTETPLDPAAISFAGLHAALIAAGYDDATPLPGDVVVTADADFDGEPEAHFSYVLYLEPTADGETVRLVVDGVDHTVAKHTG